MWSRRPIAAAAAFLVAVSMLVSPAPPAVATDGVVDRPAIYSACVGAAARSAGFEDMVGNFAEKAADCLAHYGITSGTAPGLFSPLDIVPRWQMAVFLVRAAVPAGLVVPKATDQGFGDLDSFGPHIQEGINQLAALGIMPGTSATTYSPAEPVTRGEMASLLARFLEAVPTGPGGTDIGGISPDDTHFRDLDQVSFNTNRAIRKLFEMGITQGTTATTFSPEGWVTRAQMAVFITRMLAHTVARPIGISAQIADDMVFRESSLTVAISLRDNTYQPYGDRPVDIFSAEDPSEVFDEEGSCTAAAAPTGGAQECVIDDLDAHTDTSGNLAVDVEVGDVESLRIWLWTGDYKDKFEDGSTEYTTFDITTRASPAALLVTDSLPVSATKARFGQAVTFTFQLVDKNGHPVPREGIAFAVRVEEFLDNGRRVERTTLSKITGPDGSARQTFLNVDPSDELGDLAGLDLDVLNSGGLEVRDGTAIGIVEDDGAQDDPSLEWSDELAEPTGLRLHVEREYVMASSEGRGTAATVLAVLTDQYGGPVGGEQVVFSSNDIRGVPNGVRRTTNSNGVADLNYLRDSDDDSIERITGSFEGLTHTTRQYWVARLAGAADGSGAIRVVDTATDTVIVVTSSERVLLVEYDTNDVFNIGPEPAYYSDFEENLAVGDVLSYKIADTRFTTINSFTLTKR